MSAADDPYPGPKTNFVVSVVCAGCGERLMDSKTYDRGVLSLKPLELWGSEVPVCEHCDHDLKLRVKEWWQRHPGTVLMA